MRGLAPSPLLLVAAAAALLVACGSKVTVAPGGSQLDDTGLDNTGDGSGTDTDGGAPTDGGTAADGGTQADGGTVTWGASEIAKLQQYEGVSVGDTVSVQGIVTSPDTGSGFYMADAPEPWAGIWVFHEGALTVSRGDLVQVTGQLIEFNDLTEIDATVGSIDIIGTHAEPEPLLVAPGTIAEGPNAEQYEGVVVTVQGVDVTSLNPDHPDDFGEFMLAGGLRVDDYFYDADPGPGQSYSSLTGVLIYSFGQYKLAPRDAADATP